MGLFRKERGRLRSQTVALFRYKKGLLQRKKTLFSHVSDQQNKKQLLYAAAKLQRNTREKCRGKAKELHICFTELWNSHYWRSLRPGLR